VYAVSLLLIRTIIHYHVSSKIDIKSFHNTFYGLSYWGEQMKEKRWAVHVARTGEKRVHIGFSVEV
jgi:membrane protein CcdC involved in cytochrome C biogenesis